MIIQKKIHAEFKIFHVRPKKKGKFFLPHMNPISNFDHFSLHTTIFDLI